METMKKLFTISLLLLCQLAAVAQTDETTYTLTLLQEPEDACILRYQFYEDDYWRDTYTYDAAKKPQVAPGQRVRVKVSPSTNFVFEQIQSADTIMLSNYDGGGWSGSYYYTEFTMPAHDVTITATLHYDPELPDHPGQDGWDEATGSLSITYFTPGQLYDAIRNATRDDDYNSHIDKIRMLIVAGNATNQDMSNLRYLRPYLRHLDLSRTAGITDTWNGTFENDTVLRTVLLPASIERIGGYAFQNSPLLESVTCYATTPPEMVMNGGKYPFDGCSSALTIYVPAESLPLYAEADGWKALSLMPITQGVQSLTVSLPAGADLQQYKDMKLELVNAKTGQARHYVLTNRTQYTFTNLIQNTQYNVYIRNTRGDVLGSILGVEINKQDVQVGFSDLKAPSTITLLLTAPEASPVDSDAFTVTWTDPVGNFLQKGATLSGQLEGAKVIAKVRLGETLGTQYVQPADTLVTVGQGSPLSIPLQPLPQTALSGTVTAASTGLPIRGANIAVTQQLNGLYPVTLTTTTDAQGHWTLNAYVAQTDVTMQATGYVPQTVTVESLPLGGRLEGALRELMGTTLNLDLSYRPAVRPGEQPEADADFSGWSDISYTVYDETHQQQLTDIQPEGGRLILQDQQLAEGTRLRVTANSLTGLFAPTTATCTVGADNEATATLSLVQLGQLKATFSQTDNTKVVGVLYNADGQLQAKGYYTTPTATAGGNLQSPTLTLAAVPDGRYTLVTMGESQLFNGVQTLAALTEMGLEEHRDYVSNEVSIQSGRIDSLHNQSVPMLDESIFYWTTENTHFTANKTSLTVGNYVTLRTQLEFKEGFYTQYVYLLYDLPEGCELVEGSVMVANRLAQYEVDGRRVSIRLWNNDDVVRFCVVPTTEGTFEPTASVSFSTYWREIVQPLGSVSFTADALTISVPERVSQGRVQVSGLAIASSDVYIYEGNQLIGHTDAGPDGAWSMRCSLVSPYNLSQHEVHAEITTPEGITMQTESRTVTVSHGTLTPVVYASNSGTTGIIKWDFRDYSVTPKHNAWPLGPGILPFTFSVDFYNVDNTIVNDTTLISNVVLHVLLSDDSSLRLKAAYNKSARKWVAQNEFSIDNTPKNVYVDFLQDETIRADRQEMDDMQEEKMLSFGEIQQMLRDIYAAPDEQVVLDEQALFDELSQLLATTDPDQATRTRIDELIDLLTDDVADDDTPVEPFDNDQLNAFLTSLDESKALWRDNMLKMFSYVSSTDTVSLSFDSEAEVQNEIPMGNGSVRYTSRKLASIDEQALLGEGYRKTDMTDGNAVFMLRTDDKESYIDTRNRMQYTFEWQERAAARGGRHAAKVVIDSIFDMGQKARFDDLVEELYKAEWKATYYNPSMTNEDIATQVYLGTVKKLCDQLVVVTNNLYQSGLEIIQKQTRAIYWETINRCNEDLKSLKQQIDNKNKEIKNFKKNNDIFFGNGATQLNELSNQLNDLKKAKKTAENDIKNADKYKRYIDSDLRRLPSSLYNAKKQSWVYNDALTFMDSPMGLIYWLYWTYFEVNDVRDDLSAWQKTYQAAKAKKEECEGTSGEAEAQNIYNETINAIVTNGRQEKEDAWYDAVKVRLSGFSQFGDSLNGYIPHTSVELSWYYCSWGKTYPASEPIAFYSAALGNYPYLFYASEQSQLRKSEKERKKLDTRIRNLKCDPDDDDDDDDDSDSDDSNSSSSGRKGSGWSSNTSVDFYHDPSGFVYEAVSSNRLEGVRATCYYKEEYQDMYGDHHDRVVLWNAEEYAQENPLFTDADGRYRWDVPQGLWQVKYEKDGYETTHSDWLPVPPPQLEVNVGMTQLRQPAVSRVKAYPDGIDITFDKYMRPQTLTTENIFVTVGGQAVSGTIKLLDADSGYETPDSVYASRIRFVTNLPSLGEGSRVGLSIRKAVESYAGLQMEQDFTQQFDVEQRLEAIVADSLLYMSEGSERTITVRVLPAEAAKGKQLRVASLAPDVVAISNDVVTVGGNLQSQTFTLDQSGQARVTLTAASLGSSAVRFTLTDDDELTATTTVIVRDSVHMYVYAPRASRMSGTEIYRGAEIKLTCQTAGATILYTLDGTCPCDPQSASVRVYDAPIVATGDSLVIRAMAVVNGLADSDVAEFHYKVIFNSVGIDAPDVSDGSPAEEAPALYYRLDGQRLERPERGLVIIRRSDGTVRKTFVR